MFIRCAHHALHINFPTNTQLNMGKSIGMYVSKFFLYHDIDIEYHQFYLWLISIKKFDWYFLVRFFFNHIFSFTIFKSEILFKEIKSRITRINGLSVCERDYAITLPKFYLKKMCIYLELTSLLFKVINYISIN